MVISSLWDEDVRNDMNSIGWNPFNANENMVMSSAKISFYKGVPVFKVYEMGESMSLGVIFFDDSQGIEVLKHERGHNSQLMYMGLWNYLVQIGIPSMWKNGDETPWELSASILGGSSLADKCSLDEKKRANIYFTLSNIPILNIYNILFYILCEES